MLTTPLFDRATVRLANGRTLTVTADNPRRNRYIDAVTLDGVPVEANFVTYEQLMQGGELHFSLCEEPNLDRGTEPEAAPYSLTRGEVVSVPYTTQSVSLFTEPIEIDLATTTPGPRSATRWTVRSPTRSRRSTPRRSVWTVRSCSAPKPSSRAPHPAAP